MRMLIYMLFSLPFFGISQNTLTVSIEGLQSSDGFIGVAIYNSDATFLKDGKTFAGAFENAKEGTTKIAIPDLPKGTYAVSIFHDKNGNKELDTNFLGIPKEPVAFSKAKMKTFGPPDFAECSFEFTTDFEIEISIK